MTLVTLCTPTLVLPLSWMEIWSMWLAHVYCLSRTNIKDQKTHLPNQLKTKLFLSSLSLMRINSSPQIKIPTTLNPQSKIIFGTTMFHHYNEFPKTMFVFFINLCNRRWNQRNPLQSWRLLLVTVPLEVLDITVIQRNLQSGLVDMKKPSGTHVSN